MGRCHSTNERKLVCGHISYLEEFCLWSWGYMALPFSSHLPHHCNNSLCVNLINLGKIYTSFICPTLSNTLHNQKMLSTCIISFNSPDNAVRLTTVFPFCRWGNRWELENCQGHAAIKHTEPGRKLRPPRSRSPDYNPTAVITSSVSLQVPGKGVQSWVALGFLFLDWEQMTGDLRGNVYNVVSKGGTEPLSPQPHYSSFSATVFPLSLILGLFQFTQSWGKDEW